MGPSQNEGDIFQAPNKNNCFVDDFKKLAVCLCGLPHQRCRTIQGSRVFPCTHWPLPNEAKLSPGPDIDHAHHHAAHRSALRSRTDH